MVKIKNNVIALIGMTGCGKTSVGRILAKKSDAVFIDLDDEIVIRHGEIKKIFAEQGEEAFRKLEYATLKALIGEADGRLTVLSCGGGLPTFSGSRELLCAEASVVWLRRSPESVLKDEGVLMRPPVNGDPANYKRLLDARYPIYRSCADYSFYNAFPQRTARSIIKKLQLNTNTEGKK